MADADMPTLARRNEKALLADARIVIRARQGVDSMLATLVSDPFNPDTHRRLAEFADGALDEATQARARLMRAATAAHEHTSSTTAEPGYQGGL